MQHDLLFQNLFSFQTKLVTTLLHVGLDLIVVVSHVTIFDVVDLLLEVENRLIIKLLLKNIVRSNKVPVPFVNC